MLETKELEKRQEFLRIYANLPLAIRKDVIVILDDGEIKQPVTWVVAYLEIKNKTSKGDEILRKLESMQLI